MTRSLTKRVTDRERARRHEGGLLWVCVPARVAEHGDEEHHHAIKVKIADIDDEREPQDLWVPSLAQWIGKPGYGSVHMPEIDSPVLLFGEKGDGHYQFYVSRYNDDYQTPEEFRNADGTWDGSRGWKNDSIYRMLNDKLLQIICKAAFEIGAQVVNINEGTLRVTKGGIGVLGNAPFGKRTLPPPASDLESIKTLVNALRQHEIDRGYGQ